MLLAQYFTVFFRLDPPVGVELRLGGSNAGLSGPVSGTAGLERTVECVARGGSPEPSLLWFLGDVPVEAARIGRDASGSKEYFCTCIGTPVS